MQVVLNVFSDNNNAVILMRIIFVSDVSILSSKLQIISHHLETTRTCLIANSSYGMTSNSITDQIDAISFDIILACRRNKKCFFFIWSGSKITSSQTTTYVDVFNQKIQQSMNQDMKRMWKREDDSDI